MIFNEGITIHLLSVNPYQAPMFAIKISKEKNYSTAISPKKPRREALIDCTVLAAAPVKGAVLPVLEPPDGLAVPEGATAEGAEPELETTI